MERYYQKDAECMEPSKLRRLQEEKLIKQVRHVWDNVPYYRAKMEEKGVAPEDIKELSDISKLPFITKEDLRISYPDGLLAVPRSKVVRMHSTSGTTGKRVIGYYTQEDLDMWESCCARALVAAGATEEDVCQICYGYGLFTGGMGIHGGSQKVGCLTVPMSSGNTERQLQFMEDIGSTILCCTPSYAAYLAECIIERGLKDKIKLKAGILGAEAWSEEMRQDLENKLGITAYDIYGLTELSGPGVAFECSQQNGMHINEDHFLAEAVDPVSFEPVPDGCEGELVITALDRQAFPLLRYRTKDICVLSSEPCKCGRTHRKIMTLRGRSDDMLIIKGVNVFPSQIEAVLIEQGYQANYQIVVDRVNYTDTVEVKVEMTPDRFSDSLAEITGMEKNLSEKIKTMLGIYAKVRLVAPRSIERSEGKAVRVIDKRKI